MSITSSLFHLQELDTAIEHHERALASARREYMRNAALQAAEVRLAELRSRQQQSEAQQRAVELDLASVEAKIKHDRERMYGGQVVDPREIASLEREIEHYRVRMDELEGEALAGMDRLEQLGQLLLNAESEVETLRRNWEEHRPSLAREGAEHQSHLQRLRHEREDLVAGLDSRSLSIYTRLRQMVGHAVAPLTNGVCGECRVVVPPRDAQQARSGALVTCSNCTRILYAAG